jgi:2'-5' RNA ligase
VLWVGVEGDLVGLRRTADGVRRESRRARLPFDRKPLRPHLTLARPGDRLSREDIDADVADLAAYRGPEWTVDSVDLVRSHLGPDPSYDRLLSVRLA